MCIFLQTGQLLRRSWLESVQEKTTAIVDLLCLFPSLVLGQGIGVVFEFKLRKTSKYKICMPDIHVI